VKLEFSWHIFQKSLNIKLHETPFIGSRVILCRRTDWHDEAFRNIANAPINEWLYRPWGSAWILCEPVSCQAHDWCSICSTWLYRYMYIAPIIPYRPTNKLDFCNSSHSNQRDGSGGKNEGVGVLYSPLVVHYLHTSWLVFIYLLTYLLHGAESFLRSLLVCS